MITYLVFCIKYTHIIAQICIRSPRVSSVTHDLSHIDTLHSSPMETVVSVLFRDWSTCTCIFNMRGPVLELTILTRRVPLVELELLTHPEHLSSPPFFIGVRVTRSIVSCVCFVDRCLSFCTYSFGHCVVCSSSIYTDSDYPFKWYLQTLLIYSRLIKYTQNTAVLQKTALE